jgi:hypothetical protein
MIGTTTASGLLNVDGPLHYGGQLRVNDASHDGTESNPSICVGYDNDNGFFRPTSNTIGMTTAGTERMRITATGNVGIGTDNPVAPLVVSNGGAAGMELHPELTTDTNRLTNFDRTASAYMNFKLDALTYQFNISGSEKIRIDADGNLLIGSTSFQNGAFGSNSKGINVAGIQPILLFHETDTDKDGYLGISGSNMFIGTADDIGIRFHTNDAERMRLLGNGNFGIGVTDPDQKLEVNGIGKFDTTHHTATTVAAYLSNSSNNTYMQTTTYAHQNNSSGNFNNGIHIEMGRITDSSSAEIRAFVIGARGGQSAFKVLGNDKQAGVTQDDGDFLTRMYVASGDGFLELSTGEASPVVRTKLSSYGRSFINSNSNGLTQSAGRAALSVGADVNYKAGKFVVYGGSSTGQNGGTLHYNGTSRQYKNVVSSHTAASAHRWWNIKTNIQASNFVMYVARVHGYSYGNSGAIVDIYRSGYAHTSSGTFSGVSTKNNGSSSDTLVAYYSSDNYVCFKHETPSSGYYNGYSFDISMYSPTGYNFNFEILTNGFSTSSANLY